MKWLIPEKRGAEICRGSLDSDSLDFNAPGLGDFNGPLTDQSCVSVIEDESEKVSEEDSRDIRDALISLEEIDESVPYSELRKELGLE